MIAHFFRWGQQTGEGGLKAPLARNRVNPRETYRQIMRSVASESVFSLSIVFFCIQCQLTSVYGSRDTIKSCLKVKVTQGHSIVHLGYMPRRCLVFQKIVPLFEFVYIPNIPNKGAIS